MGEHTKENIVDVTIYPRLPTNDELKNLFLEKVGTKFILKKETSSGKPHIVIYRPQARLFDDLTEEFSSFFEKNEKSLLVVFREDVPKHHLDELEKMFKCCTFPLQTTLRNMRKGSCDKKTWNDLWTKMNTLYGNEIQRRRSSIMWSITRRWGKQMFRIVKIHKWKAALIMIMIAYFFNKLSFESRINDSSVCERRR